MLLDEQDPATAVLGVLAHDGQEALDDERGQPEAELVEQQQPRVAGQGPRDREHLLLATRQQPAAAVLQLGQRREVAVGGVAVEVLAAVAEAEVLGDGQPEEDPARLGHVGDAHARAPADRDLAQILAVDDDAARSAGVTTPEIARSVVVLPAPLAPSSAITSPAADGEVQVAHHRPRPRSRRSAARSTARPRSCELSLVAAARRRRCPGRRLDHPRVAAHLVRRPGRDQLAELEHEDVVADARARAPCRGRSSSIERPSSAIARSRRPEVLRSRWCRAPPPARRGTGGAAPWRSRAPRRRACAGPATGRSGIASAAHARSTSLERLVDRRRALRGGPEQLPHHRPGARAARRDVEVLAHGEVVEQLAGLPGAREAEACPLVRRAAGESSGRRARPARCSGRSRRSRRRRSSCRRRWGRSARRAGPSPTVSATSLSACTPPKRTDRPAVSSTALSRSTCASGRDAAGRIGPGRPAPPVQPLVEGPGDALRDAGSA